MAVSRIGSGPGHSQNRRALFGRGANPQGLVPAHQLAGPKIMSLAERKAALTANLQELEIQRNSFKQTWNNFLDNNFGKKTQFCDAWLVLNYFARAKNSRHLQNLALNKVAELFEEITPVSDKNGFNIMTTGWGAGRELSKEGYDAITGLIEQSKKWRGLDLLVPHDKAILEEANNANTLLPEGLLYPTVPGVDAVHGPKDRLIQKLVARVEELEKLSTIDPLTGLLNRREFSIRLKAMMAGAKRHGRTIALIMMDLDHFKQVNDVHGHQKGDAVLREFSKKIQSMVRTEDIVGRYGGEEFIVALEDTDAKGARILAERIRADIEENELAGIKKTVSLGVTEYKEDQTEEEIIKCADDALYLAKNDGRNQVVIGI